MSIAHTSSTGQMVCLLPYGILTTRWITNTIFSTVDDKCLSVQCIYCHQTRAKNTSRQKQHLLECPGLRPPNGDDANGGPSQPRAASSSPVDVSGYGPAFSLTGAAVALDGATAALNGTPLTQRPPMPSTTPNGTSVTPRPVSRPSLGPLSKPKPLSKPLSNGSNIPAPPLEDVHSAFVEVCPERM